MKNDALPNIILIILDTVSAKRCSAYGHERDTTPGLSRMAQEATLYRHCFAPANWTIPSHASLLSGLYLHEHGCDDKSFDIPEVFYTLPEVLQYLGYHTVGICSNFLIKGYRGFQEFYCMDGLTHSQAFLSLKQEFDEFKKGCKSELKRLFFIVRQAWQRGYPAFPLVNFLDKVHRKYRGDILHKSYHATERSLRLAKRLLKEQIVRGKPLFLFINFMEAHWVYNPPPRYRNFLRLNKKEKQKLFKLEPIYYYLQDVPDEAMEKISLLHEEELFFLDEKVWELYRYLEDLGQKDRTLVIVTADHGECIGEHGLWGHFFTLYNELIHIPLIIKYPAGKVEAGVSEQIVQLQDLYATILEIIEAPLPAPMSSQSLLSNSREYALAEELGVRGFKAIQNRVNDFEPAPFMLPCRCLIDRDLFKVIEWADGRLECYDLKSDPSEAWDLSQKPEIKAKRQAMQKQMTKLAGPLVASGSEESL